MVRSFILPSRLGGKVTGFTPTGTLSNTLHERNAILRAPLKKRLCHILFDCGAWFHALVAITFSIGAVYRIKTILQSCPRDFYGHRDLHGLWIELLKDIAWPPPQWLPTIFACITPIQYALFPPDVPERDKLMGKRDENGVRYPLPQVKDAKWSIWELRYAQLYFLVVGYCVALFVGSWWI